VEGVREEAATEVKVVPPLGAGTKSASDLNSRSGCNSTGSIAMKMTTSQLIEFSLCKYGLKVSDLF
jgi:hypothetical protein